MTIDKLINQARFDLIEAHLEKIEIQLEYLIELAKEKK